MKAIVLLLSFVSFTQLCVSQNPNLGAAANFVLFTKTGAVGNTGVSSVVGKIGTNNGAITGFTPVPGQEENANTITAQAAFDLQTAYDALHVTLQTFPSHAAVLGNDEILNPGVYLIPEAASIEGTLILDAQGNPNAIFIFKIEGAFSPGPSSIISLMGGATACNVYWAVEGGAVAIATLAEMKGNFIANPGAVSMAASSTLDGRLLSTTGAIAVDGVIATLPLCFLTLPVNLTGFTARKVNARVDISWTVENEVLFTGYEVQRSPQGQQFTRLATIPRSADPNTKTYSWTDNAPLKGINFYRLKLIDENGRFSYSPLAPVYMGSKTGIAIYPNPVTNHTVMLDMKGQPKGTYMFSVYTESGQQTGSGKIMQNDNGGIQSIGLDKKLPAGVYFLKVAGPGSVMETIKFSML